MSKFWELTGDKVLKPNEEAMIVQHTVNDATWLYLPRYILINREPTGGYFADLAPTKFRVELTSPAAPGPFTMAEFEMNSPTLFRSQGFTVWGHQNKCKIYATSPQACRIRLLVACTIEETYPRLSVGAQTLPANPPEEGV